MRQLIMEEMSSLLLICNSEANVMILLFSGAVRKVISGVVAHHRGRLEPL